MKRGRSQSTGEKFVLKDGRWAVLPLERVVLEFPQCPRVSSHTRVLWAPNLRRTVPGVPSLPASSQPRASLCARLRNIKEPSRQTHEAHILVGEDRLKPNPPAQKQQLEAFLTEK